MELYPIKFNTIYKDKIWGGQKIKTLLQKDFGSLPNCGETWEISGVSGNISVVSTGELKGKNLVDLILTFRGSLVGERIFNTYGEEFPLLIKFIDAAEDLSIQVHPDDSLAELRHGGRGKTEMWYIIHADANASLISGFNKDLDKKKYLEYFESGRLTEILNREKATKGDVFFLPAGRVHTIGAGLLLAEIQQTSDITYRIYDFDRVDTTGKKRELHVEEALDAIDFKKYENYKTQYISQKNNRNPLVVCPFFTTNKLDLSESFHFNLPNLDCFKIYIGIEGQTKLVKGKESYEINMGEAILVPANWTEFYIEPAGHSILLESYVSP